MRRFRGNYLLRGRRPLRNAQNNPVPPKFGGNAKLSRNGPIENKRICKTVQFKGNAPFDKQKLSLPHAVKMQVDSRR